MSTPLLRTRPARRRHLPRRARRWVLVVHVVAAGVWLGLDVVLGLLVLISVLSSEVTTRAVAYQALGLVTVWPMTVAGVTCLFSGVVLGLGTKYGLVRYWWVAVKLVINVVLTVLVLVLLRPGVEDLAGQGRALLEGVPGPGIGHLFMPPIVSTTALLVATVLSVFKPWGRIPWDPP